MEGLTLLWQAFNAGLEANREGDLLVLRGPKRLEPLARALLTNKTKVLPLLAWDEPTADRLLREVLDRITRMYRPGWRERLRGAFGSAAWLKAEARIEAAALVHDVLAFVRAVNAYEGFIQRAFIEWAKDTPP